ncbi:PID-CTERM protein-sorting domain-containing protein [Hymenobacter crusticola]|uniref:VPDSG-CTERM protein sorting domain-containing protein n=1 Tax=Hymenobacter crusticola TaxID=1770526 RepID=A0A243W828_9BACT|nr:hypothetical protein [Hymenobacter crusticola]OUJ71216.1 hypothetical protein BXP70_22305 [Hymenobacter crusticola]
MKKLSTLFRLGAVLFIVAHASPPAQALSIFHDGLGPDHGAHNHGQPATGAPIDGGASMLLASGAAYAVHRIRRNRKKA